MRTRHKPQWLIHKTKCSQQLHSPFSTQALKTRRAILQAQHSDSYARSRKSSNSKLNVRRPDDRDKAGHSLTRSKRGNTPKVSPARGINKLSNPSVHLHFALAFDCLLWSERFHTISLETKALALFVPSDYAKYSFRGAWEASYAIFRILQRIRSTEFLPVQDKALNSSLASATPKTSQLRLELYNSTPNSAPSADRRVQYKAVNRRIPRTPKRSKALKAKTKNLNVSKPSSRSLLHHVGDRLLDPSFPLDHVRTGRMHSWIQFLTTPTADTPGTALLLHFDQHRYVIGNIHEGLARASMEMGAKLVKVSNIFVTGKTEWRNTGGLIGMVLTLADTVTPATTHTLKKNKAAGAVQPTLTVHGGSNIAHTLATARRFVLRKGMPVEVKEYSEKTQSQRVAQRWEPDWADECLKVWTMAVEPSGTDDMTTPKSPRKRSFEEFSQEFASPAEKLQIGEPGETVSNWQQKTRANVISEMFNSEWRMDNLQEMLLADVVMPATIFVSNPATKQIHRYEGPLPWGTQAVPHLKVLVRKPWPGALQVSLPSTEPSETAISYVIRCHAQRGKFLPANAIALNVPKGRLWTQLSRGLDVQSLDGKTIKPEMVMAAGKNGGGVVIADLPSHRYVRGLLDRPEWQALEVITGVEAVIWILGPGVSQNKELQTFINNHKSLKHIVSSEDHCPNYLSFGASAAASIRMNQVDPKRYPVPIHNNNNNIIIPRQGEPNDEKTCEFDFVQAERGLKLHFAPSMAVEHDLVLPILDTAAVAQEVSQDVLELAKIARNEISTEAVQAEIASQDLPSSDAEIICLGTGSAAPSKYRNVSATLLRVPGKGSYLFDCGESTIGQLRRVYTPTELSEVLRDLKLIWISHLHADHHLGTTSVIKAWSEEVHGKKFAGGIPLSQSLLPELPNPAEILLTGNRLCVISNEPMLEWLREYSQVEDFGFDHLIPIASHPGYFGKLESRFFWNGSSLDFRHRKNRLGSAFRTTTGLSDIATCAVSHCNGSQAVCLTFSTGFKFSYSGDCRPSKAFALIGRDSTVLLHEATFDDERQGDAIAKRHSTMGEAIAVGKEMRARRILLTHFSQRYQKIPVMSGMEEKKVEYEEVGEAADAQEKEIDHIVGGIPNEDIPLQRQELTQLTPSASETKRFITKPQSKKLLSTKSSSSNPLANDVKIGVAFDYMRVKVADIMHLEKYVPAMIKLHEEQEEKKKIPKTGGSELLTVSNEKNQLEDEKSTKKSRSTTLEQVLRGIESGEQAGAGFKLDDESTPEIGDVIQTPHRDNAQGRKLNLAPS